MSQMEVGDHEPGREMAVGSILPLLCRNLRRNSILCDRNNGNVGGMVMRRLLRPYCGCLLFKCRARARRPCNRLCCVSLMSHLSHLRDSQGNMASLRGSRKRTLGECNLGLACLWTTRPLRRSLRPLSNLGYMCQSFSGSGVRTQT